MSDDSRTIAQLQLIVFVLIGLLATAIIGVVVYKRSTARKLRLASLNVKVRELELTAIRAQMNPHFLYNALNSIQNLVQKARLDEAHLYLSKFATLIQSVLKYSSKEEISLHEELEMIREYVGLEQLRFAFDFQVTIDGQIDPYSIFVPPLLLQPVVENAIVHGLAHKANDRKLEINIKWSENHVCIFIHDNGIGRKASHGQSAASNGKGLRFSEERLSLLADRYGEDYTLEVSDLTDEQGKAAGTLVKICFAND